MKLIKVLTCWRLALLIMVLGGTHIQAQNIARGRSFLKAEAYTEAYIEFLRETKKSPKDPEARTLAGLANFMSIIKSKSFNDFLDRVGFEKEGRYIDDWTSTIDQETLEIRLKTDKLNGQDLADFIQDELISNLEKSLTHFESIPANKSYLVFLSEEETKISDVFLDQGDVSMIQSLIEFIQFNLHSFTSQNMQVDIQSILNLLNDEISVDSFMNKNPNFLKNVSSKTVKAARASFISFIEYYMLGSERLKNRSTKKLNHLVSIDEEQLDQEADFREHLTNLMFKESLNSLFRIEVKESTVNVSADPVRLIETPIRRLTRVDGLLDVIQKEAAQMGDNLDQDMAKHSNKIRARIILPDLNEDIIISNGADIMLLQGDLQLAQGITSALLAHDLNIGLQEFIELSDQEKMDIENILNTNLNILSLNNPKLMSNAKSSLSAARHNLEEVRKKFELREIDNFGLLETNVTDIDELITTLNTLLTPGPNRYELTGAFDYGDYLINPDKLWNGKVNVRKVLPEFKTNTAVPNTLPDETVAGLFPEPIFINAESKLAPKGDMKWVYKAGDKLPSSPAIADDGTVYIASLDKKLNALDLNTGKKKWELNTDGKIYDPITIGLNNQLYFKSSIYSDDDIFTGTKIVAVDSKSKKVKWDYYLDYSEDNTKIGSFSIGKNSNLYVTTEPKYEEGWVVSPKLIELNGNNGNLNWDMDLGQSITANFAMDNNGIIYSTTTGDLSYALDTKDQSIMWNSITGSQHHTGTTIIDLNNIYTNITWKYNPELGWSSINQLIALSAKDGKSLWTLDLPEKVVNMSIGPSGDIVFGTEPEYNREFEKWDTPPKLYSVNSQTGEINWKRDVTGAIYSSPAISQNNTLYVGTRGIWNEINGAREVIIYPTFYAIDGFTGKTIWSINGGGSFFSSPVIAEDGTVIVGSNGSEDTGHKVYAFKGSFPLADSPWPMLGQNPKRTFNISEYASKKHKVIITKHPSSKSVYIGNTATFTVLAENELDSAISGELSYQWLKDDIPIDAFENVLNITPIEQSDIGKYSVKVSNNYGSTVSKKAYLNFKSLPPTIVDGPSDISAKIGENVTFNITPLGTEPLDIQWYKNGNAIKNAYDWSYTISNIQNTDFGNYSVRVKNQFGKTISSIAALEEISKPTIISQTESELLILNSSMLLEVKAEGTEPMTYQWYRDTEPIIGGNKSKYSKNSIKQLDFGTYHVEITNIAGTTKSSPIVISRASAPLILSQPKSQVLQYGETATFAIEATGTEPIDYLWFKDGKPMENNTKPLLKLNKITKADEGIYSVRVKNPYGKEISKVSNLIVKTDPPKITVQPKDSELPLGATARFNVEATGNTPLKYKWYKNGKLIKGETGASLILPNITTDDISIYSVSVTNTFGKDTSKIANLILATPPSILILSKNNYLMIDSKIELEVKAEGTEPMTYQWYRGTEPIIGGNKSKYSKNSIKQLDFGTYHVEITNIAGTTKSSPIVISRASAPLILSQPKSQVLQYGETATFAIEATGTEPIDYLWFKDGKPMENNTKPLLKLNKITKADEGIYSVRVKNPYGKEISKVSNLIVKTDPPKITVQPKDSELPLGATARFNVEATGNTPLKYKWYKNGKLIKGETGASLILPNITTDDISIYSVSVTNTFGKDTSKIANLILATPPSIIEHPTGNLIVKGGNIELKTKAKGTELEYQWFKDGKAIIGANKTILNIENIKSSDFGNYSVKASNYLGSVRSNIATIKMAFPPIIIKQIPESLFIEPGDDGVISIMAEGNLPLTYKWYKDGKEIQNTESNIFKINNFDIKDEGEYRAEVVNNFGSSKSTICRLVAIVTPPKITSQPKNVYINLGETALFEVKATGTAPLDYQWYKNGNLMKGEKNPQLRINSVSSDDISIYSVRIKNNFGKSISKIAHINISNNINIRSSKYEGLVAAWNFDNEFVEYFTDKKLQFRRFLGFPSYSYVKDNGELGRDRFGNIDSSYKLKRGVSGISLIPNLPIKNEDRTYMFWYNKNKCQADIPMLIFGNWSSPRSGVFIRARECNIHSPHMTISFEPDLNGKHKHTDGGNKNLYNGEWNHVTITYSEGKVKFYLNSKLIGSGGNNLETINTKTRNVEFGWVTSQLSKNSGSDSSTIFLDDIRVFSKSLDQQSINNIYTHELPPPPKSNIEFSLINNSLELKSSAKLTGNYVWQSSKDLKSWRNIGATKNVQNSILMNRISLTHQKRFYRLKKEHP